MWCTDWSKKWSKHCVRSGAWVDVEKSKWPSTLSWFHYERCWPWGGSHLAAAGIQIPLFHGRKKHCSIYTSSWNRSDQVTLSGSSMRNAHFNPAAPLNQSSPLPEVTYIASEADPTLKYFSSCNKVSFKISKFGYPIVVTPGSSNALRYFQSNIV